MKHLSIIKECRKRWKTFWILRGQKRMLLLILKFLIFQSFWRKSANWRQKWLLLNIKITGETAPDIKIHGKRDKLFHAILNIVDNAMKYTHENGTVTIMLHKIRNLVHVEIKDNCTGIAKKDLPHIFERFYRASKNEKASGSGLGLAIAQAIISSHHGKIDIDSKVEHGTTVSISFPGT